MEADIALSPSICWPIQLRCVKLVNTVQTSMLDDFTDMQCSVNSQWLVHDGFDSIALHTDIRQFIDFEGFAKTTKSPASHKEEFLDACIFPLQRQHKTP